MKLPESDYQILKLTASFYNAYPNASCKEILKKRQWAYNCLLFQTHYNYFICIPYRTEISHPYAFHFKTTESDVDEICLPSVLHTELKLIEVQLDKDLTVHDKQKFDLGY